MNYTLFNKSNKKPLTHPKVGIWATSSLSEAQEMLKACQSYLKTANLEFIIKDIVIIDADSKEQIN